MQKNTFSSINYKKNLNLKTFIIIILIHSKNNYFN